MPGFAIRVLPGYQRLTLRQREAILDLCEDGRLTSPVRVVRGNDFAFVVDKRDNRFKVFLNGEVALAPRPHQRKEQDVGSQ